jgi:hypothetical protein
MELRSVVVAMTLACGGAAHAQNFATGFEDVDPAGTFTTLVGNTAGNAADRYLRLANGSESGLLTFTVTALTPFYLLEFWYSGSPDSGSTFFTATVRPVGGSPIDVSTTYFVTQNADNPGPDNTPTGTFGSYYFGSPVAPGTYELFFNRTSQSGTVRVDNVSLTAVPEPGTYALMLAGLGVVGFAARRRKEAQGRAAGLMAA